MPRNQLGQYRKKSKAKVVLNWIILLGVIGGAIKIYTALPKEVKPEIVNTTQTELCMKDERCKAKVENFAAQTNLQKEIDRTKAEYEAKMREYNAGMEKLRSEELSLQ